ncbi:MAG: GlsB/YeaQ/YmgE family stress response membrane protein [Ideonella sp.]|nr:GlsB/YeaQ/YmgE family stress response membrane protein [Ideonella sp.]MCC7457536.1 GlsB/YeaQ/YmgE family stress response membrane protein [Nitrospira sp.]
MQYVWMVIIGFVVGLVARALLPGDQKLGLIMTAVLGIVGSVVAGFIGQAVGWYQPGQPAGFIASIVGAIVVLFVYSKVTASSSSGGASS